MKNNYPRRLAGFAAVTSLAAVAHAPAFAQSSVTLYGIVDNGFGYQSSATSLGSTAGGHSAVKMITGSGQAAVSA